MFFDDYIKNFVGQKIDYDNVYGVQCVDLIKHYIKNVLEIEPQSIGNAIDYYNKRYSSDYLTTNFKWLDYEKGFKFKKGDIIVFKSRSVYGHIGICSGQYGKKGVRVYDENYKGTGAGITKRLYLYNDANYKILGVLRPIDRDKIEPIFKLNANYKATEQITTYQNSTLKYKLGHIGKNEKFRILLFDIFYQVAIVQYNTKDGYKVGVIPQSEKYKKL